MRLWALLGGPPVADRSIVQCYDHSYQAAFLEALERNPESTAILIFPTKALANDQLSSIKRIFNQKARQDAVRGSRRCVPVDACTGSSATNRVGADYLRWVAAADVFDAAHLQADSPRPGCFRCLCFVQGTRRPVHCAAYDGDTERTARESLRQVCQVYYSLQTSPAVDCSPKPNATVLCVRFCAYRKGMPIGAGAAWRMRGSYCTAAVLHSLHEPDAASRTIRCLAAMRR